ncbi:AMP-binding protein [Chroococcidiopsis thermalis]|uniref:Amino acid adenylation domain protein n=1 Tax=Chroococcidiopsis thermalis (strain PCC 7203) TaxID=251229 RepID=K9TZ16_CHRTP|nr:AMP-binding protein [Chroococcidiopsis thermalis]AFY87633.1 amino acid adenylation domain protein [Chroococcidiopsis thermalis PCC 7203]
MFTKKDFEPSVSIQSSLAYWKQQLAGVSPLLSLPTDRPRRTDRTYLGSSQSFVLSRKLTAALSLLSRQEGVTLFTTLLAAFDTLLYRYTGTEDIIVGSPVVNQNYSSIDLTFINALVLRTDLSGNPSFRQLLERVRKVISSAQNHQNVPLSILITELNLEVDPSYSPLFQVTFTFNENVFLQDIELSSLATSPWGIEDNTAKMDLALLVEQNSQGLRGKWLYNASLFDSGTIDRLNGHFQTLLASIVANPQQPISELSLLTTKEQQQLLVEFNNTQTDYPRDKCIHQLFEQQVVQNPERVAAIFEEQQLTYGELNAKANRLACYLQQHGVSPDVLVGLYVERSLLMMVALLGIHKAGGAYVPLDPNFPPERISFMLQDSQAPVIVTQQKLIPNLVVEPNVRIIAIDTMWDEIEQQAIANPDSGVKLENLSYVIYTSGSTGKPKGVMVEHRNVVNFFTGMDGAIEHNPPGVWLAVTSLSFDISVLELFWTLARGFKVVIYDPKKERTATVKPSSLQNADMSVDTDLVLSQLPLLDRVKVQSNLPVTEAATQNHSVAGLIARHQVTHLQCTPSMAGLLIADPPTRRAMRQLRQMMVGGEALTEALALQLQQIVAGQIHNMYGPTETAIWSATHTLTQVNGIVPVGRPIANTELYILDKNGQPVPVGVAGELLIGGEGVTRGYLNRLELTQERFIPNPFSQNPTDRLYRTGDLARYRMNGNVEFLGRIDFQVKVRGYRIELGEIETILSRHEAVREAVIVVREDVPGDKRLVAYVLPQLGQQPVNAQLREYLLAQLPEYMVPSNFVMLEAFPLTPNNKVDRKALPALVQVRQQLKETFVATQDELELKLTKIWEKVLGIQPISLKHNFFELGGNSLIAVRLFAEIEKTWSRNLPLATLFERPTVEKLADLLRQEESSVVWSSLVPIQPNGSKPPLFCIHEMIGDVLKYYPLANYLGCEQPVYGLRAQGLDGKQEPLRRVEDMANHYIDEIRSFQPNGPYFLAGFSFGGLVAFEMARTLHAQGQKVALLALFDTSSPNLVETNRSLVKFMRVHLSNLWQLKSKEKLGYVENWVQWKLHKGSYKDFISRRLSDPLKNGKVIDYNFQAVKEYIPQVYPKQGKVTLFRCKVQDVKFADRSDLGWGELISNGLEIEHIPGDHLSLLKEPVVQLVAEKLKFYLEQAQTEKLLSID